MHYPFSMIAKLFQGKRFLHFFAFADNRLDLDLLFLDIQMPHITGVEFLRALRNPAQSNISNSF
jgi:CheY-like chemotaxis protein